MKLKQYLNELAMKSDTIIKQTDNRSFHISYDIKVSKKNEFGFDQGETFQLDFYENLNDPSTPELIKLKQETNLNTWEIDFNDQSKSYANKPKGKGIALKLFAAIEKLVKEFIKTKKPKVIVITGIGPQKAKIYDFLSKKIVKSGKYKLFKHQDKIGAVWEMIRKDLI